METPEYFDLWDGPLKEYGEITNQYVNEWNCDQSNPKGGEHKLEEVVWTNMLLYGVRGGWAKDQPFNADFMA
jgi:hypothetical protein